MPDNVKTAAFSVSIRRLLRPLVKIMLREGLTYPHFAAIAQIAFVESAAKDFSEKGMRSSIASVSALTGIQAEQVMTVMLDQERYESTAALAISNPFAEVLHGWHNDRDYVGPYGFPVDLPFDTGPLNFTILANRHAPGVAPQIILQELKRIAAVTEVGANVWKPLKQEYIEPSLSPENLGRMASLVESLLATLENNTRTSKKDGTDLFERTVTVESPLTQNQLVELHKYMKVFGAQFLQRVDAFAAIDLQENLGSRPGEIPDIRAGLQCFLFVEPKEDASSLRDAIEVNPTKQ